MIQRSIKRLSLRALIVDDELTSPTVEGRAARALRAPCLKPAALRSARASRTNEALTTTR